MFILMLSMGKQLLNFKAIVTLQNCRGNKLLKKILNTKQQD